MAEYGRNISVRLINSIMLSEREFNTVLGTITYAWGQRDFIGALDKIEAVIGEVTPEMQAHCLLFRGMIKRDKGLPPEAHEDWLTAIPYSRAGSFVRCCLEYEIGKSFEKAVQIDDARVYYQSAIRTCAYGDEFAGNKPLTAFLRLNNGRIPSEDKAIVAAAVKKSWRVLELPGEPDLNNLSNAVTKLAEGFSDKVRQAKEG